MSRNDEKSSDHQSHNNFKARPNQYNHANTNPVAYNSDISLNKGSVKAASALKANAGSTVSTEPAGAGVVVNGHHSTATTSSNGENRSEDGNLSIPHIADFYPEGQ